MSSKTSVKVISNVLSRNTADSKLSTATRRVRKDALLAASNTSLHRTSVTSIHGTSQAATTTTAASNIGDSPVDVVAGVTQDVKHMSDLPGPIGWPVIGNFLTYLKKENYGKIHHVQARYHEQFGPMFREKWGPKWQVHVGDPDLAEQVYRQQGKYPNRPCIQAWVHHRKVNDIPAGLLTSQGEEWLRVRSLLEKKLLAPTEYVKFVKPLASVTDDFVSRLDHVRRNHSDEHLADSLPNEIYKWGMECAGVILFDRRLGCTSNEMSADTQDFIYAINDMLDSSMKLIVGEKLHQKLDTRFWRRHADAWDRIFSRAKRFIQDKMDDLNANKALMAASPSGGGCPFHNKKDVSYIARVLASGKLTVPEVMSNFCDMLVAGSDTTSNSVCFVLYLLANNPDVQARLQEEIHDVTKNCEPDFNPVGKMPYLDSVIKEAFRLYPLATMQCRILDEDIVLDNHIVPKDTLFVLNHYAICRSPKYFDDPEEFVPERWIRDDNNRLKYHPFASMPFGYGKRTCIGMRFARLELHLALTKLLQKFEVRPIEGRSFEPRVWTILTPGQSVPVRFVDI